MADAVVKCNVPKNSYVIAGESSTTAARSLKRKLEAEFDSLVSEMDDDLDAIDAFLQKWINAKYGLSDESGISGSKTVKQCAKKTAAGVVLKNTEGCAISAINTTEEKITAPDTKQKLKATEIIDLTEVEEEFEISPLCV